MPRAAVAGPDTQQFVTAACSGEASFERSAATVRVMSTVIGLAALGPVCGELHAAGCVVILRSCILGNGFTWVHGAAR